MKKDSRMKKDNPMKKDNRMKKNLIALLVMGTLGMVPTQALAGAVAGPVHHRDTVSPNSTDVFTIVFEGAQRANIRIKGDHSSDLDCFVYDSNGYEIDSDVDFTDYCVLSWTTGWTGKYRVKIRNRGNSYNEYHLTTN